MGEEGIHINFLEMRVVQLVLSTFLPKIIGELVMLMSNNGTMVVYLKKQEGTVSRVICGLVQEIVDWSQLHLVTLSVRYIPGKKKVLADHLSCPDQDLPTELSLLPLDVHHLLQGVWVSLH